MPSKNPKPTPGWKIAENIVPPELIPSTARRIDAAIKRAVKKEHDGIMAVFRFHASTLRQNLQGAPAHNVDQWNQCIESFERVMRDVERNQHGK